MKLKEQGEENSFDFEKVGGCPLLPETKVTQIQVGPAKKMPDENEDWFLCVLEYRENDIMRQCRTAREPRINRKKMKDLGLSSSNEKEKVLRSDCVSARIHCFD